MRKKLSSAAPIRSRPCTASATGCGDDGHGVVRPCAVRASAALLLGANAFALLVAAARARRCCAIYDVYLLSPDRAPADRRSPSLVAEAFREAWLREQQVDAGPRADAGPPPERGRSALLRRSSRSCDLGQRVLPPTARRAAHDPPPARWPGAARRRGDRAAAAARADLQPERVRVLDAQGCVVATPAQRGRPVHGRAARGAAARSRGRYAAVLRERISDEPAPPLGDIRRRGTRARVHGAAGVLRRRGDRGGARVAHRLDALSSLWANRRGLLVGAARAAALVTAGLSLFLGAIALAPAARDSRARRARVAHGERRPRRDDCPGFAPAEVAARRRAATR